MRNLAGYVAKGLKTAGSIMSFGRTPSTRQFQYTHQNNSSEVEQNLENDKGLPAIGGLSAGTDNDISTRNERPDMGRPSPDGPFPNAARHVDAPVARNATLEAIGRRPTWRSRYSREVRTGWGSSSSTVSSPNSSSVVDTPERTLSPISSTGGSSSSATSPFYEVKTISAARSDLASSGIALENGLGSNNPWKDHTMADEALAKSLQQEEYRSQQMERDMLLAYALANGTADDGDIALAHYMARETASLILSTENSAQTGTKTSESYATYPAAQFSLKGKEKDQPFAQIDSLRKAKELEEYLTAQASSEDANLAFARQLQASYDREANNDDAWQEWKKSNIDECIVCGDEHHRDELLRPCEHGYCEGCLQDGFKRALSSKTVLKCCKPLDIEYCTGLTSKFILEYQEMILELTTLNPLYCSLRKCGTFLPPSAITGDVGTCTKCKTETCKHCTKRHHPGKFCKEDKETNAVKELAKSKGWKTCPGCNHLIERQSGCLHMVCSRCQTAFCYRCEKRWKDCESTCPDGEF
jgi:E3 ubiquitin-protein ligase RNF144